MHKNRSLTKQKNKTTVKQDENGPVEMKASISDGITYELCAGIVDKDLALNLIVKQEVLEECGYDVPQEKFEKIFSTNNSVGISGSLQSMFYAEVTDEMIVSKGGGNVAEGESIEIYYLPRKEMKEFIFNESLPKPSGLIAAFFWYLNNKSQEN